VIFDTKTNTFIDMRDVFAEEGRHIVLNEEQLERYNSDFLYNRFPDYVLNGNVPVKDLETLKGEKRGELLSNYNAKLALGFTSFVFVYDEANDEVNEIEITLRLDELAQVEFTKMKSHLSGISEGLYPVWDYQSIKYKIDAMDYYELLIAYGDYLVSLKEVLNDKQALIYFAENETQLNEIGVEF
jgi:hypothetical protein